MDKHIKIMIFSLVAVTFFGFVTVSYVTILKEGIEIYPGNYIEQFVRNKDSFGTILALFFLFLLSVLIGLLSYKKMSPEYKVEDGEIRVYIKGKPTGIFDLNEFIAYAVTVQLENMYGIVFYKGLDLKSLLHAESIILTKDEYLEIEGILSNKMREIEEEEYGELNRKKTRHIETITYIVAGVLGTIAFLFIVK